MDLFQTEGIILHTLNFQDYDQILTVFSPDLGIRKFFAKGVLRPSRKGTAPSLLTQCEFIYKTGKSDLLICNEFNVFNSQLSLRKDFATLQAACDLLKTIQTSQMPEKPAPELYRLLLRYLEGLPLMLEPQILVASFRLKLMRYEGHLHLSENCRTCQKPLEALYYFDGECFCSNHRSTHGIQFSAEETLLIYTLAYCRSLRELRESTVSKEFERKLKVFLYE